MLTISSEAEGASGDDDMPGDPSEDIQEDSSGDEGNEPATKPYLSLLRSLVKNSDRKAKRRKLDHLTSEVKSKKWEVVGEKPCRDENDEEDPQGIDNVEEPEELDGNEAPEDMSDDEEADEADSSDPFEVHFADPEENELAKKLKAIQQNQWQSQRLQSKIFRTLLGVPKVDEAGSGTVQVPAKISSPADLKLKQRLRAAAVTRWSKFNEVEETLAPLIFNYHDTLFCERSIANGESLRWMACLHAVNLVFK